MGFGQAILAHMRRKFSFGRSNYNFEFLFVLRMRKIGRNVGERSLACINLSHNFLAQSLGGGDSGMKT